MASRALLQTYIKTLETADCADYTDGKDKIIRNVQVQSRTIEPSG